MLVVFISMIFLSNMLAIYIMMMIILDQYLQLLNIICFNIIIIIMFLLCHVSVLCPFNFCYDPSPCNSGHPITVVTTDRKVQWAQICVNVNQIRFFGGNHRSPLPGISAQPFLEPLVLLFLDLGHARFSMDCNLSPSTGWSPI